MYACPECNSEVAVEPSTRVTTIIVCGACQSELEVVSTDPIELALAPAIEEDWGE